MILLHLDDILSCINISSNRIFYKNQNDVQRPHLFNDRTFYKVQNAGNS